MVVKNMKWKLGLWKYGLRRPKQMLEINENNITDLNIYEFHPK